MRLKHIAFIAMSSFLDRLKKKQVIPATPDDVKQDKVASQNKAPAAEVVSAADQLKVDIFQSPTAVTVYAQIAGANVTDIEVIIEGDNDIVTIKGQRTRPSGEHFQNAGGADQEHVLEECTWGKFYRQIILPSEVDPEKAEAKMREGVLMLLLPHHGMTSKGVRLSITEIPV